MSTYKNKIKKYQKWCSKYGYNSKSIQVLLWFFNRYGKVLRVDNKYYIVHKKNKYVPEELINIFKNNNGGKNGK